MTAVISMLRGVNVGGHNKINMANLRTVYESLGLRDVQSYIQSGNVVFRTEKPDLAALAPQIETAIERHFGFRPDVLIRTCTEMKDVIARNPFAAATGIDSSKLLVTFLATDPGAEVREKIHAIKTDPEKLYLDGRELYIYYPEGVGRTKLPLPLIEKIIRTPGTSRNWNTVVKLCHLAESYRPLN